VNHRIRKIIAAGFVLGAAAGIVACTDDDELTLEEYFQQVEAVADESDASVNVLFEGITDEGDVQQFRDAVAGIGPILDEAADDLEAIDAPGEVQDEHDAVVETLKGFAAAGNDAAAGIDDIEAASPDELFVAVDEQGFGAAREAFNNACKHLEAVAHNNDIDANLNCDDEEDEVAAAEQTVRDVAAAWNANDVEAFAALFTDDGLNSAFGDGGNAPREEIVASLEGQIGDGAIEIREIAPELTDPGADVTVLWLSGHLLESYRFSLLLEDDAWKIDAQEELPVEVPVGAKVVNVDLTEFAFDFDTSQVTSDEVVIFEGHNAGTQPHHMVLAKIPEDANLDELLASEEEPPGVEDIGGGPPFAPGETSTIMLGAPLDAGRYLMVCFLPDETDPAETPHALKGMVTDFTVE
jgi:uncharacterized protein (TIGR02246 family)